VVVQLVTLDEPDTDHVTVPVGAFAPVLPVTVAVKVNVELRAPAPLPVNTIDGETAKMLIVVGEVAANPV